MNNINIDENGIILLGSTGSIGTQSLDVISREKLNITALSAGKNAGLLAEQIRLFSPRFAAITDPSAFRELKELSAGCGTVLFGGADAVSEMLDRCLTDGCTVIDAIIGKAGLLPALAAAKHRCRLALANKESLVIAGEIIMKTAAENGCEIIPVDSEHCAVFQCLKSGRREDVSRLILTASGGPFFGYSRAQLEKVTPAQALAHPNWHMGAGITIDSATMMNKGFEVIEAARLFGMDGKSIDVVIHRESIIHSMVEYIDNTITAQMSVPDMRQCISYALTYPRRCACGINKLDFSKPLTFSAPDDALFPLLPLARRALSDGGCMPAVLNAANETAVNAFLSGRLSFTGIEETVAAVYTETRSRAGGTIAAFLKADAEARCRAEELISKKENK